MFDEEEMLLEKQVEDSWQQQNPKQNNFLVKYFQLLSDSFLQQNNFQIGRYTPDQKKYFGRFLLFKKNIFIEIPSPPPQNNYRYFELI
jgi:hypothetical protein